MRLPLVLQRRIFTLCTKVHGSRFRKYPCLQPKIQMSLIYKIMSLADKLGTVGDIGVDTPSDGEHKKTTVSGGDAQQAPG